ncbi:N-alpha-acetyltransferase, non-catalitic subunit [Oleoguttula sp. CCFEE 5521]
MAAMDEGGSKNANDTNGDAYANAAARLAEEAKDFRPSYQRQPEDVTAAFAKASKSLPPGELVKDEFFTLFEAVAALEIMDPKMDSGVILSDESEDLGLNPGAPLSAGQVIGIMDHLWCLEGAWLEGYPLSQTIYTSVHVDALMAPENRHPYPLPFSLSAGDRATKASLTHTVLRAYCIAVIKSVECVLQMVQSQNFYEEEDFVTHLFGCELLPKITEEEAIGLLEEAKSYVDACGIKSDLADILKLRLDTRRIYLMATAGETTQWTPLTGTLDQLRKSHSLTHSVDGAFTDKVQRHLATSTPPRPTLEVNWEAAIQQWSRLYADGNAVSQLTEFWIRQSPASLQRATWTFAARTPCTYARALFQDRLFADGKIAADVPHFDLLLTDIRDLVLAGDSLGDTASFEVEAITDPRHRCARIVESFMDKAFDEYMNLYRMVCQNRCRIRRTFTQALPLLEQVETHVAAEADGELLTITPGQRLNTTLGKQVLLNPLSAWSRYYKLKIMAETIQLGFETDIYLDYEMGPMYWYLAQVVIERYKLLEHIDAFLHSRSGALSTSYPAHYADEIDTARIWISYLIAGANATITIATALSIIHNLILDHDLIKPASRSYARSHLVHEARMKPYLAITSPAVPSTETFIRAGRVQEPTSVTLRRIEETVAHAKSHLAVLKTADPVTARFRGSEARWKLEVKQSEATCVAISVAVTVLRRTLASAATHGNGALGEMLEVILPVPEKRYHAWWVVPQLRERVPQR